MYQENGLVLLRTTIKHLATCLSTDQVIPSNPFSHYGMLFSEETCLKFVSVFYELLNMHVASLLRGRNVISIEHLQGLVSASENLHDPSFC